MARRRFFVDHVHSGHAEISGENAHHLTRVLRVEAGQKFEITDNDRAWLASVEVARKDLVRFQIIEELAAGPELPSISLYLALIKFERFEWAVEKATELGVTSWQSVRFRRSSSVSPRGEGAAFAEKLRSRMINALEQSSGAWLPRVLPETVPADVETFGALRIVLHGQGGPMLDVVANRESAAVVLLGPEGGLEEEELARLVADGWRPASLGPTTLRFETAAVAALSIVRAVQLSQPSLGVAPRAQ